ncbi:MFS transporter [Aureimonas ureilytica]|uniref:MFS transporter n=1 Tax=Aureimonas ureilytica TaxID=401562 RepID=A0A175RH08_9HYPH|nr:MFS transporter [Aureimonas ureilytica]KTR02778.1 MFS transporter [Aureimonas ureilytica]
MTEPPSAIPAQASDGAEPPASPLKRLSVWSWIGFDFAAQPFFTVVLTFVFGPYFVAHLASDPAEGQSTWALAASLTGLCIAIASPVVGQWADRRGPVKPMLLLLGLVQVLACLALWRAAPGSALWPVAVAVVLAGVAAELSVVLNDTLLPSLVPRASLGLVSNIAWGTGYVGGILALLVTLGGLAGDPESGLTLLGLTPWFGLDPAQFEGARAAGPLAALWYVAFVWPMFLFVPDRPRRAALKAPASGGAVRAFWRTLVSDLRDHPRLARFIAARMLYQDGINALLVLGGAFAAATFGWTVTESGVFGLLLAVAASFGCLGAAFLDRRFGPRPVLLTGLSMLTLATIAIVSTGPDSTLFGTLAFAPGAGASGLFAAPAEKAFLLYGLLIGIAFGPVQASSRSALAMAVPAEDAARWFGLYALAGRATGFLAPLLVAVLTALASLATGPTTATRIGMAVIALFFVAGLALLPRQIVKGRAAP